jgi:MazG family protein
MITEGRWRRMMRSGERLEKLVELMRRLRGPEGCPWDREQTLESLCPFILEEAYELVDAIENQEHQEPQHRGGPRAIQEETGDLLLEVLFVSQICAEAGLFTLSDAMRDLEEKIVRRHPHVFGSQAANDAGEALAHWEEMKSSEKKPDQPSNLKPVPRALPALVRAAKLSSQAARVGFDWPAMDQILDKLREELDELERARASGHQDAVTEEVGDLLFVMVNIARHLGVDPELALRSANRKFEERFRHIEERLEAEGRPLSESTLEEMEALWQEAKEKKRRNRSTRR